MTDPLELSHASLFLVEGNTFLDSISTECGAILTSYETDEGPGFYYVLAESIEDCLRIMQGAAHGQMCVRSVKEVAGRIPALGRIGLTYTADEEAPPA